MTANGNEKEFVMSSRKPISPIFPRSLRKPAAAVATAREIGDREFVDPPAFDEPDDDRGWVELEPSCAT